MNIAIIGIAGHFPGANDLEKFYHNLLEGKDSVNQIGENRLISTTINPELSYIEMACLEDIDLFDHKYFNIPKSEANKMAPHHRLAMLTVQEAFDNAGLPMSEVNGSKTSVFCGYPSIRYEEHADNLNDPNLIMGVAAPFIAGRISRFYNLRGASLMVDTACSSSLVALQMAVNDLQCSQSEMSVVVGVNIEEFPIVKDQKVANDQLGANILSSTYRAKAFSDQADGTGIGEAVVAVIIKPLEKAIADQDKIHAVIKGIATNQDAALSASLTSPDASAQAEVMVDAWQIAGINPEDIGFIEAHGTGTILGDPIEIEGMTKAFRRFTNRTSFCSVSSVKSNIGHTDSAAGLVGLTKAVLSLRHATLFKNLHFEAPNPYIDFANAPVFIQRESGTWESNGRKRLAGVSAFGLIGTNCHVVLEEYPVSEPTAQRPALIPVSGMDLERLKANKTALQLFLKKKEQLSITDIAKTLGIGRNHYACRNAFVAETTQKLIEWLDNEQPVEPAEKATKTLFVFSHQPEIPESFLEQLLRECPGAETLFSELIRESAITVESLTDIGRAVITQVVCLKWLVSIGVTTELYLGDGLGKQTIAFLQRKTDLASAIRNAESSKASDANFNDRIRKFVEAQTSGGSVDFIEMGIAGNILKSIRENCQEYPVKSFDAGFGGLQLAGDLYSSGYDLNWKHLCPDGQKIELPAYQFAGTRCWIKEAFHKKTVPPVHYRLKWEKVEEITQIEPIVAPLILITGENTKVIEFARLANKEHDECELVASWSDLEKRVEDNQLNNFFIIDLQSLDSNNFTGSDVAQLSKHFKQQLGIIKRLSSKVSGVAYLGNGLFMNESNSANLSAHLTNAFVKSLLTEIPKGKFHFIDISENWESVKFTHIVQVFSKASKSSVALREQTIYEQFLQRIDTENSINDSYPSGAYLITGGVSGIGFELAKEIAGQISNGKILLIGRRSKSLVTSALKELMHVNDQVIIDYLEVDVANKEKLQNAFETLGKYPIRQVIHTAGVAGSGKPFEEETIDETSEVLLAKTVGTEYVLELAGLHKAEKIVLFSSLNTLAPMKNSTSYLIANTCLNFYSGLNNVVSACWPGWIGIGMSAQDENTTHLLTREQFLLAYQQLMTENGTVYITKQAVENTIELPFFHSSVKNNQSGEIIQTSTDLDIEGSLLSLWKQVLEDDNVSLADDFFDLGGHSLLGAKLINGIKECYGVDLDFEDIYDLATVQLQADFIRNTIAVIPDEQPTEKTVSYRERITPAQEAMWVASNMDDYSSHFNIPGLIEFDGIPDKSQVEATIREILYRHAALRTQFENLDGEIFQYLQPFDEHSFLLKTEQLSGDEKQVSESMNEQIQLLWKQPFDLEKEQLIRFRLFESEWGSYLFMVTHHIISDAISLETIVRDFITIYRKKVAGETVNSEVDYSYFQFLSAEKNYLESINYKESKDYLLSLLTGIETLVPLQSDFEIGENQLANSSAFVRIDFSQEQKTQLQKLRTDLKVSPFVLQLGLIKLLLHKVSNQNRITVAVPQFGRYEAAFENTIGMFVNHLLVSTEVDGKLKLQEFINKVDTEYREVLKHKRFPVEHLRRFATRAKSHRLYNVVVNFFEDTPNEENRIKINDEHEVIVKNIQSSGGINSDLSFEVSGINNPGILLRYDSNKFSEETMLTLANRLKHLITNACLHPAETVKSLDTFGEKYSDKISRLNLEENF